jgi:hypothetical protein
MVEIALRAIEVGEFDRRLAALERQVEEGQMEEDQMEELDGTPAPIP